MRHYVYALIDSGDDEVFYIGEGIDYRVFDHEEEARNGKTSNKTRKIREIWKANNEVLGRVLGKFETK